MEILSPKDIIAVADLLDEELPRQILALVAQGGQVGERQVVDAVCRWLPHHKDPTNIVRESLAWFVRHGDLERGAKGLYHSLPPYLIGQECDTETTWILVGDPRLDSALRADLRWRGLDLTTEWARSAQNSTPVGWKRCIRVPMDATSLVQEVCACQNVNFISTKSLEARLPRLDRLRVPSEPQLSAIPSRAGIWEVYRPHLSLEERWAAAPEWRSASDFLVRWRSDEALRSTHQTTVYYHSGNGMGVELGRELAALWPLEMDRQAQRVRAVWLDRNILWSPRVLPLATQQWLEMVTNQSVNFAGPWLRYLLPSSSAASITAILQDTLGLNTNFGCPV